MECAGAKALLLGATGAVGRHVLRELLSSKHYTQVFEVGRRVTELESLHGYPTEQKLVQKVIDFEKLDEAGLGDMEADVVIITVSPSLRLSCTLREPLRLNCLKMGTYQNLVKTNADFVRIDREYVINAAKHARSITGKDQHLIYLSSTGANASSPFLYVK